MSRGSTARQNNIALRFIINNRQKTYRVAVVVSKKVSKSAVVRNRIRRRVFEAVAMHHDQINKPLDLVFFVYSASLEDMPFSKLQKQVRRLFAQTKNTN